MKDPDHHDPAVDEHLRGYRKAIGLFNNDKAFSMSLKKEEIELINNFVCNEDSTKDKWLDAQLCARRRFLEDNKCFMKTRCKKGPCLSDMSLEKVANPVMKAFGRDNDESQIFGPYLDRVFESRKEEFRTRLCNHSCHKEMKGRFGLTCLRRWPSFTPALSAPQKVSRGGGYFVFKCDDDKGKVVKGVVIDPGLYFLENFFEEGFSVQDIDAVLLTHHHLDHRDDLESILTLIHEAATQGAPNNIKLVVTNGAWDDIASMIRRNREHIDDIYTIENGSRSGAIRDIIGEILIDWRDAYHNCFESDSVGYRLWLKEDKEQSVRFTGDTIYAPGSLRSNLIDKVIMLNLGGIVSDKPGFEGNAWKLEKLRKSARTDCWDDLQKWILETGSLENHLYLAGALQLLSEWEGALGQSKKGLAILCELPEELLGGHRKNIAKAIQNAINSEYGKEKIIVLPEDVGLRISYSIKTGGGPLIECLNCSQLVPPEAIKVIPWGLEERLMFVCKNCMKAANPYLLEEKFKYYRDRGRRFERAES